MTLQDQAMAILAPPATLLDSPHARDLAASQLVPVLMTVMLHAKDIGQKPLLPEGVHELLSDVARVCIGLQAQWSTDDQREARVKAEALIGSWVRPERRMVVTGLRGKVIGMVSPSAPLCGSERENTSAPNVDGIGHCFYCGRDNPDAATTDYCSRSCSINAIGEGA